MFEELGEKVVAVVGASGFIGSSLASVVGRHCARVIRVSRQDFPPKAGSHDIKADITQFNCWLDIVDQADIIFLLAGNTSIYAASSNPAQSLLSTVLPVNHLIRAANELGRHPRVIYSSTATVYGLTEKLPVTELAKPRPITVYDLHKLFAEQQLTLATKQSIIEGISLRLANVYGPSASVSSSEDRGIINKIARFAIQNRNLSIYGDGNYLRDYVYIDDVIMAFLLAGTSKSLKSGIYNIGSGVGTTVLRAFELVVDAAEHATGYKVHVNHVPWPANADPIEARNFVASVDSFSSATNWGCLTGLETGINLLVSYYLSRPFTSGCD